MSEHLPEPWSIRAGSSVHVVAFDGENPEPYTVANCYSGPFAPSREIARSNARRIVACVNACRGIPTEELETEPNLYALWPLAQRSVNAELLAACDLALSVLGPWAPALKLFCSMPESSRVIDGVVKELTDAIARARGETPPA